MYLSFVDALEIVRDLANENVLEEFQARDNDLEYERLRQLEAVSRVDDLLTILKGHRL